MEKLCFLEKVQFADSESKRLPSQDQIVQELIHDTIDIIIGEQMVSTLLDKYSCQEENLHEIVEIIKATSASSNENEYHDLFNELGVAFKIQQQLWPVIHVRKQELHEYFQSQASTISNSVLIDYDYSIRTSISSSSLASIREPLVVLKLRVRGKNGVEKNVILELNRHELETTVKEFGKINAVIEDMIA